MQTVLCWTNVNTLTLDAAINYGFGYSQFLGNSAAISHMILSVPSRNDVVDPGTQVGTFLDVAGCR